MILTRQTAIPVQSAVTVTLITSTIRDLPTEVCEIYLWRVTAVAITLHLVAFLKRLAR